MWQSGAWEILTTVKPLAAEYYRLTGEPLGVTGEVAAYLAVPGSKSRNQGALSVSEFKHSS